MIVDRGFTEDHAGRSAALHYESDCGTDGAGGGAGNASGPSVMPSALTVDGKRGLIAVVPIALRRPPFSRRFIRSGFLSILL
jgi:hypothetical protein